MRTHQSFLAVGVLLLVSLVLIACGSSATSATGGGVTTGSSSADEGDTAALRSGDEAAAAESAAEETGAGETASEVALQGDMQASLTPLGGTVKLRRAGEEEFLPITGVQAVGKGDIIRTGADGVAIIAFATNTEATLFPNSQVAIKTFSQDGGGAYAISLQQFIGNTFHRANFAVGGSVYEVETLNTVATVTGTAFYVTITSDLLEGLDPGEIEDFINSTAFFQHPYGSDPDLLDGLGQITVVFDVAGGQIVAAYLCTDQSGAHTGSLSAGQIITILRIASQGNWQPLDEDTNLLTGSCTDVTFGLSSRSCGDGICDPYLDEDTNTCPADCP